MKYPKLAIISSKVLNPFWKYSTVIVAEGGKAGMIIVDQIKYKDAKELVKEINDKGLPDKWFI